MRTIERMWANCQQSLTYLIAEKQGHVLSVDDVRAKFLKYLPLPLKAIPHNTLELLVNLSSPD